VDGRIKPLNNLVATPNNLDILLVIETLDKIYQKLEKMGCFLLGLKGWLVQRCYFFQP